MKGNFICIFPQMTAIQIINDLRPDFLIENLKNDKNDCKSKCMQYGLSGIYGKCIKL